MGRKVGALPLLDGGAAFPSNTMWPEPRPSSIPSGILIHPVVWPQYTNVTDRQDNGPVAWKGARHDGDDDDRRTVTCNGRPKMGVVLIKRS